MPSSLNRRSFLKHMGAAAGAVGAAGITGGAVAEAASRPAQRASSQATLNILCWEGYTDPSFVGPFEKMYNCTVTHTYAGSSDEMVAKWIAGHGNTYDLVSASGDADRRFIHSRTLLPIDVSKLKNFNQLYPKFHAPPWNTVNGIHYGVSFVWGANVLIYDTRKFKQAPASWEVLYDHKYKNEVSIYDSAITIADVALYLGWKDCYNLNNSQLAKIKTVLQQQKPLLRKYWAGAGDVEDAFQHGELVASSAWPLMTNDLRKAHFPIGETVPREGATGWADTWMISKSSPNVDLAMKWIDYMIGPQGQLGVINVTAYSGSSRAVVPALGPARVKALHMDDQAYFDQLHIWSEPVNYADWVKVWTDVRG
ncbi:MAG TPA: ABC transporter substrate-binding protein [Chloroflexota bacterium]|nr:ABC transporter substrate-binding protein [Chloroflexota bacterium]